MANAFELTNSAAPPSSTIGLQYSDLLDAVTDYLGYGPSYTALVAGKQIEVERVVAAGVRGFYVPLNPQTGKTYRWSFLYPTAQLVVANEDVALPSGFGGLNGPVSFSGYQTDISVSIVPEGQIRTLRATMPRTGVPSFMAVTSAQTGTGSAWAATAMFWPDPDTTYILLIPYFIQPPMPSDDAPYLMGGSMFADAMMASCLARAELLRDDAIGPRAADYKERLLAAISMDEDMTTPESFGILGPTDGVNKVDRSMTITVAGVTI